MFRTILHSPSAIHACVLTSLILAVGGMARADDRDLLRERAGEPFVFVTFDTSTSMASTPPCTRERAVSDMDPFDVMCTTECPLDDATCARICPDFGCEEYDFSSISPPDHSLGLTIVRDEDTATQSPPGSWTRAAAATARNNDFLDDGFVPGEGTELKSATYDPAPDLAVAGDYMVFLWWPEDADADADGIGDSFASNVLVDVEHAGGIATVAIDQRFEGGRWNPIGTWEMASGTGQVTIRNESGSGMVVADAVGWLSVTKPGCKNGVEVYRCQQPVCPRGNCFAPLNGDDPTSKFFQAKQALFQAITGTAGTHLGFATFEQDNPRVRAKHWLYRVSPVNNSGQPHQLPTLNNTPFIEPGELEVFGNYSLPGVPNPGATLGDGFNCVTGAEADQRVGCEFSYPADLSDPWETQRARRIPKLGREGNLATEAWYRVDHDDNQIYKVLYNPSGSLVDFGSSRIEVDVDVVHVNELSECGNGVCEVAAGESCLTCEADCNGSTSGNPNNRFCCGTADCGGENAVDCTDPRCTDANVSCSEDVTLVETLVESKSIWYELVSDYVAQDGRVERQPMEQAGFFQGQANVDTNDTCQGLEPNDDSAVSASTPEPKDDEYRGFNLRWETLLEEPRGSDFDQDGIPTVPRLTFFDVGDFVPLDWTRDHRGVALSRLAPNTIPGGSADTPPDFRVARYFEDDVLAGDDPLAPDLRKLRLTENVDALGNTVVERPIIAVGSTPLGESLADFRHWFAGTNSTDQGWSDFAVLADPLWPCRQTAVLLLTDGIDECFGRQCIDEEGHPFACTRFNNDPCTLADELFRQHGVKTYVVGFGIGDGSSLDCIAANGGTEEPLLPQNHDELVAALGQVFGDIQVSSRAFASASIPAIQSTSADKIFLSSFTPFPGEAFWAGRIDAFRKPLPLTPEKRPDFERKCVNDAGAARQSGCHIWEAGMMLCEQSPEAADAASGDFRLGSDPATERRVVYGQESAGTVPNSLQLFDKPPIPSVQGDTLDTTTEDLLRALDPSMVDEWYSNNLTPAQLDEIFQNVIATTLEIKVIDPAFEDVDGCALSGGGKGYVLGDVFHASPVSLASPDNVTYLTNNMFGYRDFADKHEWRRRMLAAPTNDGQLHFFDSGIRQVVLNTFTSDPNDRIELFNDGSGHELFSYVPRFALPILEAQASSSQHIFSLDNTVATGDVFIDPIDDANDDTQWRTVLIGSLREGGDVFQLGDGVPNFKGGYFALDVTQPDVINPRTDGSDPSWVPCPADNTTCDETTTDFDPEYTPSCLDFFSSANGSQSTPADCDFPFPMELWTFDDSVLVPGETETYYLDEDKNALGIAVGNGIPDLADSWSRPVIGQIQVCRVDGGLCNPDDPDADDDLQVLQVAIFAGGMDARRKGAAEVGGNFLYMIDIETGEAIYKRELEGSTPADPAVLDIDRDGFFDRIYVGTTKGKVYKVDLSVRAAGNKIPGFDDPPYTVDENHLVSLDSAGNPTRFTAVPGTPVDPPIELRRISNAVWDPFEIFDTGGTPIYHAPVAFFVPERNQYGLALGTGDREDLWSRSNGEPVGPGVDPVGGRFVVFVDEDLENDPAAYTASACIDKLPISAACLENIDFTDPPDSGADYLLKPREDSDNAGFPIRAGWILTLTPDSRISSEAFVVAGILIFSAFEAVVERIEGEQDFCAQTGKTRAFVVALRNAGPIAPLGAEGAEGSGGSTTPGERDIDRFHEIDEFTTAPFIDSTVSKNPQAEGKTILDEINDAVAESIRQALVRMFPRGSRFNKNFSLVIAALRNSTGVSVYATVPIAVYPADWRDQ